MPPEPYLQEVDARCHAGLSDLDLSLWSRSRARRVLEIIAIAVSTPVLLPLVGMIALAAGATSGFPILFRQMRSGMMGSTFQILKFRTMQLSPDGYASGIAVESAQRITPFGAFLRRTKLDELPQVWNVLRGEMSLVGPRPKVPEQQLEPLPCRPGITGVAALAFAREESVLQEQAPELVESFFHQQMLPAKLRLDAAYMNKASLSSDLRILLDTVLGRWRTYAMKFDLSAPRKQPEEIAEEVSMLYQ